jgi:hypothetical protein
MPLGRLAPQEQDVHALLRLFLRKVDSGRPLAYPTFREAWQEMHFSLIYEVSSAWSLLPASAMLLCMVPSSPCICAVHPCISCPRGWVGFLELLSSSNC